MDIGFSGLFCCFFRLCCDFSNNPSVSHLLPLLYIICMKDDTLKRIAFACTIIGLVVLYLWQSRVEIPMANAGEIGNYVGKTVRLKGTVADVSDYEKTVYLKVAQPSLVPVVVFKDHNFTIINGTYVEITGEVTKYKGKLQLVASQIKVK
jgi:hypothetical protein